MAWSSPLPADSAAQVATAPMTANNVIFLILFGMFLMATLLPVLVNTLFRFLTLVATAAVAAAVTNPSDQSFALWISQQNEQSDLMPDASLGVSKWISAVYNTAKSLVCNKPLTWRFHNALIFSVVYVPSKERYALGVFGSWRWADESTDFVKDLCQAAWVIKISRGGTKSGIDNYLVSGAGSGLILGSGSLRRKRVGNSMEFQADFGEVTTQSHRKLREKALQCKLQKDWNNAATFFLQAAKAASEVVTQANYEFNAVWCNLESLDTYPVEQNEFLRKVRLICDTLASAGYFDEAAHGLCELALRLKQHFPTECKTTKRAKELAKLYVEASDIAEAGGNIHCAAENGLRAAGLYADACLWELAEKCFEAVGKSRLGNGQNELANEAYNNAVLCRLSQLDFVGAEDMLNRFTKHLGGNRRLNDMDMFLSSLLQACNEWSLTNFEKAFQRYVSAHQLALWQRQCLCNLKDKLEKADLR
ncbi:putative NSF attachment protein [Plasmopara halstedii]